MQVPTTSFQVLTLAELAKTTTHIENIAGGGHAMVFKVERAGQVFALRLDGRPTPDDQMEPVEAVYRGLKVLHERSPHVIRIDAVFWVSRRNVPFREDPHRNASAFGYFNDRLPEKWMHNPYEGDPNVSTEYHEASLMPVAKGTLSERVIAGMYGDVEKKVAWLFYRMQSSISNMMARQAGLFPNDFKINNRVYFPTESETFQGRSLSKCRYWCYCLGTLEIYIPIGPYHWRAVDFDQWRYDSPEKPSQDLLLRHMKSNASLSSFDMDEAKKILSKPKDVSDEHILTVQL